MRHNALIQYAANIVIVDILTLSKMRAGMGWSGAAMCAFAYRLGGEKNLSSERCFPLEQSAETYIATPDRPC